MQAHVVAEDFGAAAPQVVVDCQPCHVGDIVTVTVRIVPLLPGVPAIGSAQRLVTVPVESEARAVIRRESQMVGGP